MLAQPSDLSSFASAALVASTLASLDSIFLLATLEIFHTAFTSLCILEVILENSSVTYFQLVWLYVLLRYISHASGTISCFLESNEG